MVDGRAVHERPDYWQLVKFAVKKGAKINFDEAKKVPKPKTTTHFWFDQKKTGLPANLTVWIVTPTPYEALPEEVPVSIRDIEIAIRVACTSETFSGRCS